MKGILLSILITGVLLVSACGAPPPPQAEAPPTEQPSTPPATEPEKPEAPPAPTTYTLSVSVSPSGAGSVSPSSGQYEEGTQVTLTATPASGYTFDYWDGDASGSSLATTITMDSNKSITAHFKVTEPEPTPAEFILSNLQVEIGERTRLKGIQLCRQR